jgi:hypothetical protein
MILTYLGVFHARAASGAILLAATQMLCTGTQNVV